MNAKLLGSVGALALLIGCGGNDPPSIASISLNPTMVAAGGETTLTVQLENFELRNPATHTHALRAADDGHEHGEGEEGEYPDGGHFHVYFDTVETNPLPLDCPDYCEHPGFSNSVRLKIPDDAQPGAHEIILRLNGDDHRFLTPAIEKRTELTVSASS